MATTNTCPCCGKRITVKNRNTYYAGRDSRKIIGVYEHDACGAVLGSCYKGDAYAIYLPYWAPPETPAENERYFDLELLGSAGIERVHGWFDIQTRRLTQVG